MNGVRMEIDPLLLLLLLMEVLVVISVHGRRILRNWMTDECSSCRRRFIPAITGPTVGHGRYCWRPVAVAEPAGSVLVIVARQQVENGLV